MKDCIRLVVTHRLNHSREISQYIYKLRECVSQLNHIVNTQSLRERDLLNLKAQIAVIESDLGYLSNNITVEWMAEHDSKRRRRTG